MRWKGKWNRSKEGIKEEMERKKRWNRSREEIKEECDGTGGGIAERGERGGAKEWEVE